MRSAVLRSTAACCQDSFVTPDAARLCTAPAWHAASSLSQAQASQVLPSHAWPLDLLPA